MIIIQVVIIIIMDADGRQTEAQEEADEAEPAHVGLLFIIFNLRYFESA